jgi:lipopolysaccharide export system protein LptA
MGQIPMKVVPAAGMATMTGTYKQQDSCLMKHPFFSLIVMAALAAGMVLPAAAEKADRDKPMNAEADALRYDDLKQTSVFTGNVIITKGTTIVRGERVDVAQDPEGYQQAVAIAAPGKLAYYRKKRDGVDEFIEGEGERIEYDSRADTVKFIKRAVVRRYNGATLADETTGALIVYDNNTDVFTVDGGAENRTAANPTGRVRAMLTPRATASAPSAALSPAAGPAPSLRPSTTLGNVKN